MILVALCSKEGLRIKKRGKVDEKSFLPHLSPPFLWIPHSNGEVFWVFCGLL